jgi:hypothetical protein
MLTDDESEGESGGTERSDGRTSRSSTARSSRRERVWRGIEGGALATLVMTVYRLPVTRSLPPTAEFWAEFVSGDRPDDHPVAALVLHFAYGAAAGGLFAALLPARESVPGKPGSRGPPSPSGEVSTTLYGLLYGLALSAVGERFVLGTLLDIDPDDRFAFHVGHALYGITLGAWVGTRTRERR